MKQQHMNRHQTAVTHPVRPVSPTQVAQTRDIDPALQRAREQHTEGPSMLKNPPRGEEPHIEEYTADSYLQHQMILLPSGKYIRLRPYSLFSAMERGELPNILMNVASEHLYGKGKVPERRAQQKRDDDAEMGKLMDWLCCKMIASFRCTETPPEECGPGEVSVYSMYDTDKVAILQFALQGQRTLSTFR